MTDNAAYPPPDSPLWVPASEYWLFWAWMMMFNDKPVVHLMSRTVRPQLKREPLPPSRLRQTAAPPRS